MELNKYSLEWSLDSKIVEQADRQHSAALK